MMDDLPIDQRACFTTLGFDAAQAILASHAAPLGREQIELSDGAGRVLAEPVVARIDSPRRDCAAMDGYAVRTEDLVRTPDFHVIGSSFAGSREIGRIKHGEAMRITTGAPLPDGADRVVVIERSQRVGDQVRLNGAAGDRPHVRLRGSDFLTGTALLPQGRVLDPFALAAAAAGDVDEFDVWRMPQLAVLATGDEIVDPGKAATGIHLVPDSLSVAIAGFAQRWGAVISAITRVADDPDAIRSSAHSASTIADVLVVAGGASRGDRDHCRAALGAMGLEIAFADVAIKPGKPVWFGRIGTLRVLGLPGNPTAALTVARLFLAPLLRGLGGRSPSSALAWRTEALVTPIPANGDREAFLCGEIVQGGMHVLDRQTASGQAQLGDTQCLIRRSPSAGALDAGSCVQMLELYT